MAESGGVFRRMMKYLLRKKALLIASTLSVILYANVRSFTPMVIRKTIDLGISKGSFHATLEYSMFLLGLVAAAGVLWYLVRYFSELLSQSVVFEIRQEAFRKIYSQSMEFF